MNKQQFSPRRVGIEPGDGPRFYTPAEIGVRLRFHPETVRRLIREGFIKAVQFGRFKRVPETELNRLALHGLEA